jgi:hypothetical protein
MGHYSETARSGGGAGGGGAKAGGGEGAGWDFNAAWAGLGGGAGDKKQGATLAETVAMASQAPKGKHADAPLVAEKKDATAGGKTSGDKGAGKGDGKDAAGAHNQNANPNDKSELSPDVKAAFPGVNLEGVAVYRNSKQAEAKRVQGFATIDEIHIAPGAAQKETERHEARHVGQLRAGKDKLAKGGKPDSKAENERQAEHSEKGGQTEAKDIGSADPDSVRYKEESHETNASEHGVPKVTFNGTTFNSIEGEFSGELAKAKWGKTKLFEKEQWWRIPAFPAAGVYVKASGNFAPSASINWKGGYSYEAKERKFKITGAVEGSVNAALIFALEGGAGLNLVIQRGGVGVEAAATLAVAAKASRSISGWIDAEGHCGIEVVPIEVDFSATLKAALNLVAWTAGWFSDHRLSWTFAEWTIATLAQYKANISVGIDKAGVTPHIGPVQQGVFTWGSPPPAEQGNGHKA